jgi:hypothetical protein
MSKFPVSAVCPSFCNELRDVQDFVSEFGPYNGHYVARFPQNWIQEFSDHVSQLKPVERQAAKILFERIKLAFVDSDLPYNSETDWTTNAVTNQAASKYTHLVGDGLDPRPFKSWIEALPEIRESKLRTWKFKGSWTEYFSSIKPLLFNAPAAYLVDRYFDPAAQKNEDLLFYLLDKIKGSRCYEVHVITRPSSFDTEPGESGSKSKGFTNTEFLNVEKKISSIFLSKIPKDRKLFFHFIDEDRPGGTNLRMHNRYFLTKHGAIDFGQGYDIQNQPLAQMDAYIVDKLHHQNLSTTFIEGVSRHFEKLPRKPGIAYPLKVMTCTLSN